MENNLLEIFQSILNINTDSVDVYSGEIQKYIKDAFTGFYIKELKDSMILSNKNIFEDNTVDMSNSLMIASHLDTLYYGQETKITEDGFIFGCGAVDDKPNLAIMIALKDLILSLKSTIILAFTYDEECYVNGSKEVANYLSSINKVPETVLLVEPTDMKPSISSTGSTVEDNEFGKYYGIFDQKPFELYNILNEMNNNRNMLITPPCESGDYYKMGSNVVICGPGLTELCHCEEENIHISMLEEWHNRMKFILTNKYN